MANLARLMARTTLVDLSSTDALEHLGLLIDVAGDEQSEEGLRHAVHLGEELLDSGIAGADAAIVHYFLGNAWCRLRDLRGFADQNTVWEWEHEEAGAAILAFRKAYTHRRSADLALLRRCQIATNLGNLYSNVGRFVEALGYYNAALSLNANFGMAIAAKANCLLFYARALYDEGHQAVFARTVADLADDALQLPLEPGVHESLERQRRIAEGRAGLPIEAFDEERQDSLGNDSEEASYREWCLDCRLYVNPLNDLVALPIAAQDVLHLPNIVVRTEVGSGFHGFFNHLKQEFAASRYFTFKALRTITHRHYADNDIGLVETWNDTVLSLANEQLKWGFRSAYSILDKIAVFIAKYFDVDLPDHRVKFRSIWHRKGKSANGLATVFDDRQNWPLRGLYWISKDFIEDDDEFHQALEPDAQEVATLRNRLEHRYVRVVHQRIVRGPDEPRLVPPDPFAYVVTLEDLNAKVLRLLRTSRAALIYLALALHQEERQRPPPPAEITHRGCFPNRR